MNKKANAKALLPILVFLILYLGLGILFEYVLKIPMGFYSIPIVVIFLLAIVGRALRGIIKFAMLGWVDRLLGAILGILAAAMIISIALILFNWLNDVTAIVKPEILEGSKIFTPLKDLGYDIFPYLKGFIAGR